ncbi:MAG: DUF177 domain-containing protein [Betaproteobacteria bacterium]|nr:DUF177 domain-containing protein [Betaproteobacteria bacterium]
MSHQPVIDGFEFASAGATQAGRLPVREFPRLRDLLASDAGEVEYEVCGLLDERGRPGLRLAVRGTLELRCRRCLEPVAAKIDEDELLVLASTQEEIDAEPADAELPDRVLASKAMALRDLVEDQIILALPYAPRHEACAAGAAPQDEGKVLPFAGLKGLMRGRN